MNWKQRKEKIRRRREKLARRRKQKKAAQVK